MNLPRTPEDLYKFVADKIPESLHLDYKGSDAISEKLVKEIAKDVSAFANSDGGLIIYSIREQEHLPVAVDRGVDHKTFSRERIEDIITSNVAPSIDGLIISQIPLSEDRSAYAIQIPKSYRGPHQERNEKRYYKRYNFKSVPMEHYEIEDIRARPLIVRKLVSLDIKTKHHFVVYLVISNVGQLPAENVVISFSKEIPWKFSSGLPPILARGIKYLPPGRSFWLRIGTWPEILMEGSKIPTALDADVCYIHPQTQQEVSESFPIDFRDFLNTSEESNEIYEQGNNIQKAISELTGQVKKTNSTFEVLAQLAAPTGLNLSVTTIRNLTHVMSRDNAIDKIDAHTAGPDVFKEVLGIDVEFAFKLYDHFCLRGGQGSLHEIGGITDGLIEKIETYFIIGKQEKEEG